MNRYQKELQRKQEAFAEADKQLQTALSEALGVLSEAEKEASQIIQIAEKRATHITVPTGRQPLRKLMGELTIGHLEQITRVAQELIKEKEAARDKQIKRIEAQRSLIGQIRFCHASGVPVGNLVKILRKSLGIPTDTAKQIIWKVLH